MMQIAPIRQAARTSSTSRPRLAPLGGWNTADPLTAMKDGYAIRLENWICRTDGLHVRPGFTAAATGVADPITSVLAYPGKMFAATNTEIRDGASIAQAGGGNRPWRSAVMSNDGGTFLIAATGASGVRVYNGTSWITASVTGVDATKLSQPLNHHRRMFFIERDSLNIWFLGFDAIQGPAHKLPLHAICRQGGSILTYAILQPKGGKSEDDQLVIVTTNNELVVYAGANPGIEGGWKLAGVWKIAKPIGERCFATTGGGLVILTKDGVLPLMSILAASATQDNVKSLSEKIYPTLWDETDNLSYPWGMLESGLWNVHILQAASGRQYIHSGTGAWSVCKWPAISWAESPMGLYFGTADGRLCKVDGDTDSRSTTDPLKTGAIDTYVVDSFSDLRDRHRKAFARVRALYRLPHPYKSRVETLTDYREPPTDFAALKISDKYWFWPEVSYGMMPEQWAKPTSSRLGLWRSVNGEGMAVAVQMAMRSRAGIIFTGYDIEYQTGGLR